MASSITRKYDRTVSEKAILKDQWFLASSLHGDIEVKVSERGF